LESSRTNTREDELAFGRERTAETDTVTPWPQQQLRVGRTNPKDWGDQVVCLLFGRKKQQAPRFAWNQTACLGIHGGRDAHRDADLRCRWESIAKNEFSRWIPKMQAPTLVFPKSPIAFSAAEAQESAGRMKNREKT
jgi:hypothetical protein